MPVLPPKPRPCAWCGEKFTPGVGYHGKFCSPSCKEANGEAESERQIAYLPTQQEIAEECRRIRSGELVLVSQHGPVKARMGRRR